MNRKFLTSLVALSILCLGGCNVFPNGANNKQNNTEPKHSHSFVILHNYEKHWAKCKECGYIFDPEKGGDNDYVDFDSENKAFIDKYRLYESNHDFSREINEYTGYDICCCWVCKLEIRINKDKTYDDKTHWTEIVDLENNRIYKTDVEAHDFYLDQHIEPTYEETGYDVMACDCGYSYRTNIVDKLNHHYSSEWSSDENSHWHACIDEGYENLKSDYAAHSFNENVHEYKDGDVHGGFMYDRCICGCKTNEEYEFSSLEQESLKYLTFTHKGFDYGEGKSYQSWVIHTNELADQDKPKTIVYPDYYLDNNRWIEVGGPYYDSINGFEYWSANGYVEEIYLPTHFNLRKEFKNFAYFPSLKSIYVEEENELFSSKYGKLYSKDGKELICSPQASTYIGGIVISSNICETVAPYAFYKNKNLEYVRIYDDVTAMAQNAFDSCDSIQRTDISVKDLELFWSFKKALMGEIHLYQAGNLFDDNKEITAIEFTEKLETVKYRYFENLSGLKSLVLPEGIISIGYNAFENCSSLEKITLPDSVASLDTNVFLGCSSLKEITLGSNVSSLSKATFSGIDSLEKITVSEDNPYFFSQSGILYKKSDYSIICIPKCIKGGIVIPEGIKLLNYDDFSNHPFITSYSLPVSVEETKGAIFSNCPSLKSISLGAPIGSLFGQLFSSQAEEGATKITQKYWWSSAQTDCYIPNSLEHVEIRSGEIPPMYFNNMGIIKTFTICKGVNKIGDSAFRNCPSSIVNVAANTIEDYFSIDWYINIGDHIPGINLIDENGQLIKDVVFSMGSESYVNGYLQNLICIKSVVIPDGVKTITQGVFSGCSALNTVIIPKSIEIIDYGAFINTNSLEKLYYLGTSEEWENIKIYSDSYLLEKTIYYYSETLPSESGNYWHYVEGLPVIWQ